MQLIRTAKLQIILPFVVTDLPVPRTVMFDLPVKRYAGFRILEIRHRKILLGRPVARIAHRKDLRRFGFRIGTGREGQAQIGKAVSVPVHFPFPRVVRNAEAQLAVRSNQALFAESHQTERGERFQPLRFSPAVGCLGPAADDRNAVIKLIMHGQMQSGFLVNGLPFQLAAGVIPAVAEIQILHFISGRGLYDFRTMPVAGAIASGHLYLRGEIQVLFSLPDECVLVYRKGGEMHQPDLIAAHLKDHMDTVFVDCDTLHGKPPSALDRTAHQTGKEVFLKEQENDRDRQDRNDGCRHQAAPVYQVRALKSMIAGVSVRSLSDEIRT